MALTDFRPEFDNAYQEIFSKALVSKEIMNTRFESKLKFGESVERVAFDISGVRVRDVVRGSASTIDTVTDSPELLTINIEKEAAFHISDGEATQAGPLNPGEKIGGEIALKVATDLDGRCFAEVVNAANTFDAGDLTTGASTGTPITLNGTTVPQMTTRMAAKLRSKANQEVMTNMAFVVDSYTAADIEQYLLGKDIDLMGSVFKNGYAGVIRNAVLYVSEALTGEVTYTFSGVNVDTKVTTINGVTFTSAATPAAAGTYDVVGSATLAATLLHDAINNTQAYAAGAGSAATYFELSAANRDILERDGIYATNPSAGVVKIYSRSGRLTVSEDETNGAFSNNMIHAYFGKKGAIDLVVQDMKSVDMRPTADRRGTNVFSSYLAGLKTFSDGAKKFLDVKIAVA
jgi:hypothetical protein